MASVRIGCGISKERFDDFDGGVPTGVIDCGETDYDIKEEDGDALQAIELHE